MIIERIEKILNLRNESYSKLYVSMIFFWLLKNHLKLIIPSLNQSYLDIYLNQYMF